ncbi:MAG: hypothetical protein JWM95_3503 [Gemmatimonadetes bacterium]|nr:hypothetical protein [Gemmatimonadota bacterium]
MSSKAPHDRTPASRGIGKAHQWRSADPIRIEPYPTCQAFQRAIRADASPPVRTVGGRMARTSSIAARRRPTVPSGSARCAKAPSGEFAFVARNAAAVGEQPLSVRTLYADGSGGLVRRRATVDAQPPRRRCRSRTWRRLGACRAGREAARPASPGHEARGGAAGRVNAHC